MLQRVVSIATAVLLGLQRAFRWPESDSSFRCCTSIAVIAWLMCPCVNTVYCQRLGTPSGCGCEMWTLSLRRRGQNVFMLDGAKLQIYTSWFPTLLCIYYYYYYCFVVLLLLLLSLVTDLFFLALLLLNRRRSDCITFCVMADIPIIAAFGVNVMNVFQTQIQIFL